MADEEWQLLKKSESYAAREAMMQERRQAQALAQQEQAPAPVQSEATPPKQE